MVTLNELTYDLLNIVRGGKVSDDESISERQVKFWIRNTRALLIRRDLDKGRSINPDIIQNLGCIALSIVDASECNCEQSECTVVRTTNRLPDFIELQQRNLITRVGPINGFLKSYSSIPYQRAPWFNHTSYTKNEIFSILHNNYVYLMSNVVENVASLTHVNVQGVLADPTEAISYTSCTTGNSCYSDDDRYPISAVMVESMKDLILKTNFKIIVGSPTDTANDAASNLRVPNQQ